MLEARIAHLRELADACEQAEGCIAPFVEKSLGGWWLRRISKKLLSIRIYYINKMDKVRDRIQAEWPSPPTPPAPPLFPDPVEKPEEE